MCRDLRRVVRIGDVRESIEVLHIAGIRAPLSGGFPQAK